MSSGKRPDKLEDLNYEILHLRDENRELRKSLKKERERRIKIIKILVVDDSTSIREVIFESLIEFGFKRQRIKFANDGQKALKMLYEEFFDLIISDWHMPGLTGLEFITKIRKHPDLFEIPFIMMTIEDQKDNILKAFSSGVNQYILKPFKIEDLREKVFQVLG